MNETAPVAEGRPKRRWGLAVYYFGGAAACLLALFAAWKGAAWYESVIVFCAGLIIINTPRRLILMPGVSRSGNEIVCRYIPLYEGNAYFYFLVLPAIGVAAVSAGSAPGTPAWWRPGGIVLLLISALLIFSCVRMWRRCLLCITPSNLKVRGTAFVAEYAAIFEIRRDLIQSIETQKVTKARWLQIEIVYRVAGTEDTTRTAKLGPESILVSVQPISLLKAVEVWKDGTEEDPEELMNRIERILRDRHQRADSGD